MAVESSCGSPRRPASDPRSFIADLRNFFPPASLQLGLGVAVGAAAVVRHSFALRMQDRPSPDPARRGKSRHGERRRIKATHKAAARRVLDTAAPVRDLRESIRGRARATPAPRTVRADLPAYPALAVLTEPVLLAAPAGRPVVFVPPAEAAFAQAEHRASLLEDLPLADRAAGPRLLPAAPAAELAPAPLLHEAERLEYQTRLVNLERFSTGLASLVDTQARALWIANARLSALEPDSLPLSSWVDAASARPSAAGPGASPPALPAPPPDSAGGAALPPGVVGSLLRGSAPPARLLAAARGDPVTPPRPADSRLVVAAPGADPIPPWAVDSRRVVTASGDDITPPWAADSRRVVTRPLALSSGPASSRRPRPDLGVDSRQVRPRWSPRDPPQLGPLALPGP